MSGIKLDSNGDIDITEGKLSLTIGLDATRQRLSQRLKLFFGEWFLDKTRGVPWIQQVFVKNPNPIIVDAIIKREIIAEPQVLEIQSFSLDLDTVTRILTVEFRCLTKEGELNFQEAFGI